MKKNNTKKLLLEQLKKMPVVELSCQRVNIGRTTYYRWRKNQKFAKEANAAIAEGEAFITDISEGQLISLIRDRNFQALNLWLKNHHKKYGDKVEVTGHLNMKEEPLTPEQEELVENALKLAGLLETEQTQQNHDQHTPKSTR